MPGKERPFGNENSAAGMSVLRKPQFPPLPQTVLFRFAEDGDWSLPVPLFGLYSAYLGERLVFLQIGLRQMSKMPGTAAYHLGPKALSPDFLAQPLPDVWGASVSLRGLPL